MRDFPDLEDENNALTSERGSVAITKPSLSTVRFNNLFVGFRPHPDIQDNFIIFGKVREGLELIDKQPE